MTLPAVELGHVGKKFCRNLSSSLAYGARNLLRKLVGAAPRADLRPDEFWALQDISLTAHPGECLGIVGPNGAGKSTLLKLVNRDFRPDRGRVAVRGRVTSLIRLGTGLRPLLTGRENIYARGSELGLAQAETERMMDGIVAFAGLEQHIDSPVKHYSDGLYARLEFAIATAVPLDILLIDEVLAVGDVAFQMRALERLEQLKQAGTTILLVSHSEMNVRQIADRCLLLFDGEALATGEPDALFRKYYESIGFANRVLKPLGAAPERPTHSPGPPRLLECRPLERPSTADAAARPGQTLELELPFVAGSSPLPAGTSLVVEFWNSAGLLMATFDSGRNGGLSLPTGSGTLRLGLPWLGLTAGCYRVAGGFREGGRWLGYAAELGRVTVAEEELDGSAGLFLLQGRVEASGRAG